MNARKWLSVVFVAFVVTAFAFANGQHQSSASAGAKKVLNIMWWGSQTRNERTIKVIQIFESEHPNVKVQYAFAGWNDYWQKATTMAAGRNLPDVMQQDYGYVATWVSQGLLIPLDPYVKSGVLDFSNVQADELEGGRINGKLYAVNIGTDSPVIVIDVKAFEKAGVPLPPWNWDWNQWAQDATQIHQKLGIWGSTGNIMLNEITWKTMWISLGYLPYARNGKSLGYPKSDSHYYVTYLQMLKKLMQEGVTPPYSEQVVQRNKGVESDPIVSGKSAMTLAWSNQLVAIWGAAGLQKRQFALRLMPRLFPSAKSPNYVDPGQFFSVTRDSKDPKTAAEFINFFTNSVQANKILLAERGAPISVKVRDAIKLDVGKPQTVIFDFLTRMAKTASPLPPPDPTGSLNFINNVYTPEVIDPFMFGKISAEQAANLLYERGNQILSKS